MDYEEKAPFDIDAVMERIADAVHPLPKAAMFELAEMGFSSVFEQLVGCIISIRTYDEVTTPTALRLFEYARTPEQMASLSLDEIDRLIAASTFHENKAGQIKELAERVVADYGGEVPCEPELIRGVRGIGVKCANLVMGIACGIARVSVDTHVHRVTNRWGYVRASTPEKTTVALEQVLPVQYWVEINRVLVPFGKNICTRSLPHCSTCPVLMWCRQVDVRRSA